MTAVSRNPPATHVPPPPIGIAESLAVFGGAGVLLYVATRGLIPVLVQSTGMLPLLAWFLAGGFGVFLPLLVIAWGLMRSEPARSFSQLWVERFRFRPMNTGDWGAAIAALAAVLLLSASILKLIQWSRPDASLHPDFLTIEPLTPGTLWILAVWIPFFVLNIACEEILWRGVVQPRQESRFGRGAWLVHGAGWLLFHIPFGLPILLTVAPTVWIIPWTVQRRQNSWIGVIVHAGLNGLGFLAVAAGLA
jgi:membrane protease YdiL (CAAX protease family)